VSIEEGAEFAQREGLLFVEASAKSGQNVELAFVEASKDILQKIKNGVFNDARVSRASSPEYTVADATLQSPGVKSSNYSNPNSLTLEQTPSKNTCCS
jgi:Ras-related protein Rab-2A